MEERDFWGYEVVLSANIYNSEKGDRFSIIESQRIELRTFAELDALLARLRNAVHPAE